MTKKNITIDEFDYPLPDGRIARHPLLQRDKCKLLVRSMSGEMEETGFYNLPELLPSDSMLIYNNTRVINARLKFQKPSGAMIEVFCLEPCSPSDYALSFASTEGCLWTCFVGNSKRWKGEDLSLGITIGGTKVILHARRAENNGGSSVVEFSWDDRSLTFARIIEAAGEIPIPPYLNRSTEASDRNDYQTIYSHVDGSVAAPTAGLHFTSELLGRISDKGIPRREVTLHVGAGTFQPVKTEKIADHKMHSEFIAVPLDLIEEIARSRHRIYAVGTTSVRTLESLYHIGCLMATGQWNGEVPQWYPYSDAHPHLPVKESLSAISRHLRENSMSTLVALTRIMIVPGYEYMLVKGMITNFHQPKSTLLLLVSAFIGDQWREMYDYALSHDFRFLSYGDACLLQKNT